MSIIIIANLVVEFIPYCEITIEWKFHLTLVLRGEAFSVEPTKLNTVSFIRQETGRPTHIHTLSLAV